MYKFQPIFDVRVVSLNYFVKGGKLLRSLLILDNDKIHEIVSFRW